MFSHLIFVGAGGTGGYLFAPLLRFLSYNDSSFRRVTLVDGDHFDEGNLTRQICGPADVGKGKASVLADSIRPFADVRGVDIRTHEDFLNSDNINEIDEDLASTLWVLAVDNHATRKLTLDHFEQRLADPMPCLWISPGNSDGTDFAHTRGTVHWWGKIRQQAFGMDPRLTTPNIATPIDDIPQRGSCANHAPSAPQLITANLSAAAHTLNIITGIVTGQMPHQLSSLDFTLTDTLLLA